jgi:hypothetical protein
MLTLESPMCLVFGVWCLVFGVWCLVFGVWCLVFGVWCLVFGVWCLVFCVLCFVFRVESSLCLQSIDSPISESVKIRFVHAEEACAIRKSLRKNANNFFSFGKWLCTDQCRDFVVFVN